MMQLNLMFVGMPGTWEMMVILAVGLLIFGKRLPEIGRSVGKSIVEFKKGIKDVEDEVHRVESTIDNANVGNHYDNGAGVDAPQDDHAMYNQDAPTGTPDDEPAEPYTEPVAENERTTDTPEQANTETV